MPSVQKLAANLATFAAVLVVGTLGSNAAQAMIVTGSVTGTWDNNFGQGVNVNVGDTYTATYSYDDTALTPYSYDYPGSYQYSGYYGSLLSLIVNSGSYSHTFDIANGYSYVQFQNFVGDSTNYPYSYNFFNLNASDSTAPGLNSFYAYKQPGISYGTPYNYQFAQLYSYDNQGNYPNGVYTYNNVKFTPDPTAVPTPALLPGLIGLGFGVLRKRKAEAAKQTSEV